MSTHQTKTKTHNYIEGLPAYSLLEDEAKMASKIAQNVWADNYRRYKDEIFTKEGLSNIAKKAFYERRGATNCGVSFYWKENSLPSATIHYPCGCKNAAEVVKLEKEYAIKKGGRKIIFL